MAKFGTCKNCGKQVYQHTAGDPVYHEDRGLLYCRNVNGNMHLYKSSSTHHKDCAEFGTNKYYTGTEEISGTDTLSKPFLLKHYQQWAKPKPVPVPTPEPETKFNAQGMVWTGPVCRHCKEPIAQHGGGMYHGHWEHMVLQDVYTPDMGYKQTHPNKWSCCTYKTSDGKFHVADNLSDPNAKKKVYEEADAPDPIAPVKYFMTTQNVLPAALAPAATTQVTYLAATYTKRKFKKG